MDHRLHARFQPQVWDNDNAVSVGESAAFDAHDALLAQRAPVFVRIASQILRGGHDYDELAIDSGVADAWLAAGKDHTLYVDVDGDDFRSWLEAVGLSEEEALSMDEEKLAALRERATVSSPAP